MYLEHLNWQQAGRVLTRSDIVAVIPVGSTEQHGDAGPLGTDWLIPQEFCRRLNESDPDGVVITPVVPFGVATHHVNFPGTIDLGLDVMSLVMNRIFASLFHHGVRRFVVINGHGGNDPAIEQAALKFYRKGALCALIDWWSIAPKINSAWVTGHGDAQEIAAVMAFREDLIDKSSIRDTVVTPVSEDMPQVHINTSLFEGAPVKIIHEIRDTTSTGGLGGLPSTAATKKWGVEMMDGVSGWINRFVQKFKTLDLPQHPWPEP